MIAKVPSFARIKFRTGEVLDWLNQTFFRPTAQVAPQENFIPLAR
jgi:hypothetical protein